MELVLWRHGDAVPGSRDSERELSAKGKAQAERVGQWLRRHIDKDWLVIASPARRGRQTADALGLPYETRGTVGPGASADSILREAGWPDGARNVLVVGHQPTLGRIAARLVSGVPGDLAVKKGAIWWFSSRPADDSAMGETSLRAVLTPDFAD